MTLLKRLRFSMGTILVFVLMAAVGSALFVKLFRYSELITTPGWKLDVPALFLIAIALTAVALGAWKDHSPVQTMLQIAITCFGCLTFLWIAEAKYERAIRYWYQATFALTVTFPIVGRQFVKRTMERGPRRTWWKKTLEVPFLAWFTLMLLSAGGLLQGILYLIGAQFLMR